MIEEMEINILKEKFTLAIKRIDSLEKEVEELKRDNKQMEETLEKIDYKLNTELDIDIDEPMMKKKIGR